MKKNISILICFLIIIGLISYNVYANFKIDSSSISYNYAGGYISVKDHLDDLLSETNEISKLGDASTGNVMLNKTGYSKGTFITGTMQNYSGVTMSISSVTRDGDYVKFNFPKNGFYGTNSAFKMTFGDQSEFYVKSDWYYSTKSVMKVPSSKVHTKVTLNGNNVTYQNTSGTAITEIYTEVGNTNTFIAVPKSGYYFEKITCTNGYTVNLNVGTSYYANQTVTLTNANGVFVDSECTITMHARSYAATVTAATPVYHTHSGSSSSSGGCYTTALYSGSYQSYELTGYATAPYNNATYQVSTGDGGYYQYGSCSECGASGLLYWVHKDPTDPSGNRLITDYSGYHACSAHPTYGYVTRSFSNVTVSNIPSGASYHISSYALGCNKTTSTIDSYKCSTGTVSGSKCYSCPNGGTLSGSTCEF